MTSTAAQEVPDRTTADDPLHEQAAAADGAGSAAGARVQLALNVSDIDAAVDFYRRLLGTEPAKRRPGYANFAVAAPPLKLVLIEDRDARGAGVAGALNHLGIEVGTTADVDAARRRLTVEGLDTRAEQATTCCYAVQDKVWVSDPDGAPWEVYTVLADAPADRASGGPRGPQEPEPRG
ncbi:MAG: Lactoylglutathione lyase @ Cadmium-induced protein CadI [uncultured Frankineae bacterium]|uniref:Lactoylglutathione lyase @ Cadmium-induced protein CadI n=1 Tax=uncultured Frankineae bacterium TaxID=437475 RepID=A0A6J4L8H0_9ACTN|nr:MAG: Lactoylglutathione lyase @ Cadmium-induced protein CadI [uncultured Frankineae bacterium]